MTKQEIIKLHNSTIDDHTMKNIQESNCICGIGNTFVKDGNKTIYIIMFNDETKVTVLK